MSSELKQAVEQFQALVVKSASKDKIGRNKLVKTLEKAKSTYTKLKTQLTALEKEHAKRQQELDTSRNDCNDARKHMMKMHKAVQNMDLANATDAIFYQDNDDVAYLVDGKEFHLEITDDGDLNLVPWKDYRRSKKQKDVVKTDHDEIALDEANAETFDEEIDDLYATLAYHE